MEACYLPLARVEVFFVSSPSWDSSTNMWLYLVYTIFTFVKFFTKLQKKKKWNKV